LITTVYKGILFVTMICDGTLDRKKRLMIYSANLN